MRLLSLITLLIATVVFAEEPTLVAAPALPLPVPEAVSVQAKRGGAPANTQKIAPTAPDNGEPQVRLVAVETDVAKRYRFIVPPLPIPPFKNWRQWFEEHQTAVHCALEWRDDNGNWHHGELRSMQFDPNSDKYRVGFGEFPGTAFPAYGVYIIPGRVPREKDNRGRPITVALDARVECDYRDVEREIRRYAAHQARPGDPGTGGKGIANVGLGGPAYKPAQNSNTMINYVLRACGVNLPAPDRAIGWDTHPRFPYSSNADAPPLECVP